MAGNLTAMIASIFSGGVTADPYYEYTTLLLPGNGTNGAQNNTFLDGSTNNFTITRNGNTTQGTFSPFSQTGWSGFASATGQYLTAATSTEFNLGSSNFTVEAWIYPTALNTYNFIYTRDAATNATSQIAFGISSNGSLFGEVYVSSTAYRASSSAGAIVTNRWTHVAFVRNGTTLYTYIDGVQNGTDAGISTSSINTVSIAANILNQAGAANRGMQGYCSNFRLAIGVAVYTGAFTPPTSPLAATQSSGTNISAITGTQTKILTFQSNRFIDNSVANSGAGWTLTVNGSLSVQAFSPFNPSASWSAATYGGSGYFDGSGDYLSTPSSTSFNCGTNNFTMECWVYVPENPTLSYPSIVSSTNWNVGTGGVSLRYGQPAGGGYTNKFTFHWYGVGDPFLVSLSTFPLNAWHHVALTRSGNNFTLWVNGTSQATGTNSGTVDWGLSSGGIKIAGGNWDGAQSYFKGFNGGLRLVKGTAVYTGAFTPPTAPITTAGSTSAASYPSTINVNTSFASSECSLLLNFTNAGIYDATSKNDLETVADAKISTAQSKFGGSSMAFDGTGDWLLIPDQPIQRIGTGNFTVEGWVYRNSSGTYGLIGKGTGTTGWLVSLNSSNQVVFTYGSSTITSTGTVSATTWTHIAVVREGTSTNQTKIYINGTNDGTGTVSTDFNQTNSMYVGADRTGGSAANAYMQDVRVTNYARYTSNFTAPTAAFPTL